MTVIGLPRMPNPALQKLVFEAAQEILAFNEERLGQLLELKRCAARMGDLPAFRGLKSACRRQAQIVEGWRGACTCIAP